jgi:hypothetical protein
MAQTKRRKRKKNNSLSIIRRLRASLAASKRKRGANLKNKSNMAFGRNRSRRRSFGGFRNPFRRRSSFRQRPARRSYGGGSGGFSRRVPLLGFKLPSILIWLAIAGGAIFFGKDYIKPLIEKFKHKM